MKVVAVHNTNDGWRVPNEFESLSEALKHYDKISLAGEVLHLYFCNSFSDCYLNEDWTMTVLPANEDPCTESDLLPPVIEILRPCKK